MNTDKKHGLRRIKVGMLSLGCARNLVDAEVMLGYLKKAGVRIVEEIAKADVAIVNSCCFIREAEEESIETILKLGGLKENGKIGKIIVCGCLAQRYKDKLIKELKEVDAFLGVGSIDKIVPTIKKLLNKQEHFGEFSPPQFLYSHRTPRLFLTPQHYAYIKISEGCSHRCSFCIIPALRGKYRSRQIDSILKEAEVLFNRHRVSEINVIGQDTTLYGQDLYGQRKIAELLARLGPKASGRWIRLLYAHAHNFPPDLIKVMRDEPSICKYIDLPIQHINDKILQKMNRQTSSQQILSLVNTLREKMPQLFIRTTLIVGFPGETDQEFRQLLDFIREMKFERLGLFKYSREKESAAYDFSPQVAEKVKQARYEQALSLQQEISAKINEQFLGKTLRVLVDEADAKQKNLFLGRTEYDAPEVDGCVYLQSPRRLKSGDFVQVKITDTLEYDLVGKVADPHN